MLYSYAGIFSHSVSSLRNLTTISMAFSKYCYKTHPKTESFVENFPLILDAFKNAKLLKLIQKNSNIMGSHLETVINHGPF